MLRRPYGKARWLLVGATVMTMAGCAAQQGKIVARNATDCPMSFTLTCDAKRAGATTELTHCRCVRQRDIDAFLDRR